MSTGVYIFSKLYGYRGVYFIQHISSGLWLPKLWYTQALIGVAKKKFTGVYIFAKWWNYMSTGVDQFQIPRPIFLHGLCPSGNDYPNFCSFHIDYHTFSHVLASCDIYLCILLLIFLHGFILWQMHTSKKLDSLDTKHCKLIRIFRKKNGYRSKQPKTRNNKPSPLTWNCQCRIMWMDFPFWFQFNIL